MNRIAAPLWLGLSLLLPACSSDMSDLEQYAAEVKSRKSTAIEPIPQIKQYEAFVYEAGNRRDPFTEVVAESRTASGPRPDLHRNKEPLEEFPLDALRMTGTIRTKSGVFALVLAPDGIVHRVTVKNYMGQNYGQIVSISESEIRLQELVPDGFGGWTQREATLILTE
ncbi:type IV pilus assembly protein PilP [Fontimonas thermophila]|uniref:Type IV pilus assembly protein PilP n=1 Tax=Fontimonas thermophila TaxID=1076937 RepID=A0A1I2H2J5_9GAMM|nr:pilus assembly protein PilP [Fontimonas thermophila]SFF23603.1 type IV pilus assembly protein PilP [Fontimonas thermophila]